jgi:hypothetical protein
VRGFARARSGSQNRKIEAYRACDDSVLINGPHPFPFPQQYVSPASQAYGRKRRHEPISPISDPVQVDDREASPANVAGDYPLVSDWLQGLALDPMRGRDNIPYPTYTEKFTNNGILRLDDLARISLTDLRELSGMNVGTAARVADWAKADKGTLDGQERKGKRMRINH